MQTDTPLTFDLLELCWWQNPWIIAAMSAVACSIMLIAGIWYLWRRRPATPAARFLQRIAQAASLPVATHAEQKKIYDLLTMGLKEYGAALTATPVRVVRGLTDYELIPFLYARQAPDFFVRAVEPVITAGCGVKFAQELVSAEQLALSLVTLQAVVSKLQEQAASTRRQSKDQRLKDQRSKDQGSGDPRHS